MSIRSTSTLLLSAFLLVGCTKEGPTPTKTPTKAPALAAAVTAKLEKADAQDGTVDKIVSNCAGCQLGMAGDAKHAATLGDYTLHLCEGCKDKVGNPTPIITQLKLED